MTKGDRYRDKIGNRSEGKADLHLDIQNAHTALIRYILDGLDASPVIISSKLRVLDETALIHQRQKPILAREVVVSTVLFVGAGGACCVY